MEQVDKEEKLIISRGEDAVRAAENRYMTKTVGFLTPHLRNVISKNVFHSSDCKVCFDGGYPNAERTMFVCTPEYLDYDTDDIISAIKISGRDISEITHRDCLGSLMGLGIVRENIGDILVCGDVIYVFVKSEIADYIKSNLEKIGRHGVTTEVCPCADVTVPEAKTREIKGTVSSMRLDAIVAFSAGVSRSKACQMIEKGMVSLDWEVYESSSVKTEEDMLLSIRGVGRFKIRAVGGLTRKGRLGITVDKYE